MITLHWLYALAGAMFAAIALLSALDRAKSLRLCVEIRFLPLWLLFR